MFNLAQMIYIPKQLIHIYQGNPVNIKSQSVALLGYLVLILLRQRMTNANAVNVAKHTGTKVVLGDISMKFILDENLIATYVE